MEFDKEKYIKNEKLLFNISIGIIVSAFGLLVIAFFVLRYLTYLEEALAIFAVIGLTASVIAVIAGNVRLIRFVFIIRKENNKLTPWNSALSIAFGLTSLIVYWFILLLLALQNIY